MSTYSLLLSKLAEGELLRRVGKGFAGVEISALTPAGNWLPDATATRDLGVTGTRWRDLFLSRNAAVGGTLGVTGATTLSSTLGVTGATTLSSTLGVTGATTLSAAAGVVIDDATVNAVTRGLTLSHTTSAQAQAGVGAGLLLRAESDAGTLRSAGAVDALHTDVTDGAEESALVLSAGRAGALLETARFVAEASAVNGLLAAASATGQPVTLHARGADTNIDIGLRAKGTGAAGLVSGGGTTGIRVRDAGNELVGATGFFGAPPATQPTAVADAAGGATVDAEARTALNALLSRLRTLGLIAT